MKMRLISLKLENFKCHDHLEIPFDGRSASIYGRNAAGKSSIYDGLTWLLFGKDSHGRKDFDLKPLTSDGTVKDHGATTSVVGVFQVDGVERTLKRTYYEVWSTKRGSAVAAFDGHSSGYFVDDVPCKKSEFARRVGELVDESVFRLLTSIHYFAADLPWQERRAILFDVAGVATDEEILAGTEQFAPLSAAMQGLTLDDYRKKLMARRKELNGVRTDIPARLDECKKTVADLSAIDFAALECQKGETQGRRTAVQQALEQIERDGGRTALQHELAGVRNALGQLENENAAYRLRQEMARGPDETALLRQQHNALSLQEDRCQRDLAYVKERQTALEGEVSACRARWDAIHGEGFQGGVCPTCGQALPQERLDASKAAFERDKEKRKGEVVAAANRAKSTLKTTQDTIAQLEQESAENLRQMEELRCRLQQLEKGPTADITDMESYAFQRGVLEAQAAELQEKLDGLDKQSAARWGELQAALADTDRELNRLSGELAKRTALDYAQKRMEELRAQAAAASNEVNRLDKLLYLCEEFLRYKARHIEESVNRQFSMVQFRLFREQVNGGLEDCCDVTVDGIPYATGLNSGAKINAGIDIIDTLSRHYNAHVPLFVDNAESVTHLAQADTQMIRLVVSETDNELRCEWK